ncbi:MAG: shikimate dehydrogenase [Austwickia sp.]|jgi:shikimate dehydrogenase|nr:MAG: shikimate dehydrogenase [Austwickia sp.]
MGRGRRAAVLGSPVAHSLSPVLHEAAYAALGLSDWHYERIAAGGAGEPTVAEVLAGLGPEWVGLSLTMPNKEAALAVAAGATERARLVGAANTLLRRGTGWLADSTDAYGLMRALREAGAPAAGEALVLGSGATARSACAALAELGVGAVAFGVRAQARPETVAVARSAGLATRELPLADLPSYGRDFELVVSTLPTGTDLGLPAGGAGAPGPGALVMDVVYGGWPTALATWAQAGGARVLSGLDMLLHQAAEQVWLMTEAYPPVPAMRAALERATGIELLH